MENQGLSNDVIITLYTENVERFESIAFRYLRDREKARDIVSECYEYVLNRKDSLSGSLAEMKTYLLLMIKDRCLNEIRLDTARRERLKDLFKADSDRLSDDNVSRRMVEWDMRKVLETAGSKMQKRAFDIYVSGKIGGLSYKELAKLYGVTQNRVSKDMYKANKIIQTVIRDYLHIITVFPYLIYFFIAK